MKVEVTAGDVQKLAGGALKKKDAAASFAARSDVQKKLVEAAKEALEDLVLEAELEDETEDDDDDGDDEDE